MSISTTGTRKTHEKVAIAGMSLGVPSIGIETRVIGTPPKPYDLSGIEAFDAWLSSCPKPHGTTLYEEARALVLEREMRLVADNPNASHAEGAPERPRG